MAKKVILIILDGLGDEYIPQLGGTPLEYISKDLFTLNKFAEEGICGLLYPIAPGVPPASDTGHLSIFGYDVSKEYPGRGFFEAMGAGIKIGEGEIAFRSNLATVKKERNNFIVLDRRAGRISGEDAEILYRELNEALTEEGIPARIIHTLEHRGVLIVYGEDLLGAVTDTDPHETGKPVMYATPWQSLEGELWRKASKTSEILAKITRLSYEVLSRSNVNVERRKKGLPEANIVLFRGGGIAKGIARFADKWKFNPAFVAAGALYKGVARALGMHEISVAGATGTPQTNLEGKVEGVMKALDSNFDFVYLHIKGTDNLSHDKKPKEKAEFILKIDRALSPLLELEDVVVVVTGDHSTSSIRGRHIGLPVPIVFWSREIRRDSVKVFSEGSCRLGGLGFLSGNDIMRIILDVSDRAVEHGTYPSSTPLPLYFTSGLVR